MEKLIKIFIDNLGKPEMFLRDPFKILIEDFPIIYGLLTKLMLTNYIKSIVRLRSRIVAKPKVFNATTIIVRFFTRAQLLMTEIAQAKITTHILLRIKDNIRLYPKCVTSIRTRLRLVLSQKPLLAKMKLRRIRLIHLFKISERIEMTIKETTNFTIKDYIMIETY